MFHNLLLLKKNFETLLTSGEDQGFQAAGGGGGRNCCSQSRQVSTGELLSGTSFCLLNFCELWGQVLQTLAGYRWTQQMRLGQNWAQ